MAPGQYLNDLWWEDRKQKQWLCLLWNILHSRESLSICIFRTFFFAFERTIQNPNIHNNLIHCFMEKHGSSTELLENQIKTSGMALEPSSWRWWRCEHRAEIPLPDPVVRLPLLQSTYGWIWLRFICKHTSSPPGSSPETQISQQGAASTASHRGDELTAEASNG